jgi:hypothetical protein
MKIEKPGDKIKKLKRTGCCGKKEREEIKLLVNPLVNNIDEI